VFGLTCATKVEKMAGRTAKLTESVFIVLYAEIEGGDCSTGSTWATKLRSMVIGTERVNKRKNNNG